MTYENSKTEPLVQKNNLDTAIENLIGDLNWSQLLQALTVSAAWFFDAQQTFITVFSDAAPTWHLTNTSETTADKNICNLSPGAWDWDAPPKASTVSEFGLQCAGPVLTGLPSSAFFAGCLIGGIVLATLADSFLGRKKMLSLSCLAMGISALLTALFPAGVLSYSLLRLAAGLARSTIGTSAIVLSTELVGKRSRGAIGVSGFVFFTLGFLSLPAIAYYNLNTFNNSWRSLYVWTSIPTIIYSIVVHFFVVESPRWLFVQGRREEAIAALKKISNGVCIDFTDLDSVTKCHVDIYSAMMMLFSRKWALYRVSAISAVGFGVGLIYYGMPLALGSLNSVNLYISVTLNALSELPASLVTLILIGNTSTIILVLGFAKMNRKSSLFFFTSLSGISSLTLSALKQQSVFGSSVQLGLELLSFFGACVAFDLILIYTVELFPTCVRNSAVSLTRQAMNLGGVFGPILASAATGEKIGFVSFGVFGLVIGFFGLFVVYLPETRGRGICDTMDEEEIKDKIHLDANCTNNKCSGFAGTDV